MVVVVLVAGLGGFQLELRSGQQPFKAFQEANLDKFGPFGLDGRHRLTCDGAKKMKMAVGVTALD